MSSDHLKYITDKYNYSDLWRRVTSYVRGVGVADFWQKLVRLSSKGTNSGLNQKAFQYLARRPFIRKTPRLGPFGAPGVWNVVKNQDKA